jgi:Family of unknown function (DUF6519)
MDGDFSRTTFDPARHFSGVLQQQGRVQLDADWNEQVDIGLYQLRSFVADLLGPHAGVGDAFKLATLVRDGKPVPFDFSIGPGRYYVAGIACEAVAATQPPRPLAFTAQPDYVPAADALQPGKEYLIFLDVWEQEVTALRDPHLREVALGGPDTAIRRRVVWQVKAHLLVTADKFNPATADDFLPAHYRPGAGLLRVRAASGAPSTDPCAISPAARYRGLENQLYRVRIHRGGRAGQATFTWARDPVLLPVTAAGADSVTLGRLGPDPRLSVAPGDWVELFDDAIAPRGEPGPLSQVQTVDPDLLIVTLHPGPPKLDPRRGAMLRRWDQQRGLDQHDPGAVPVTEGRWIALEDGVEVRFEPKASRSDPERTYVAGDYWEIPARVITGNVDWPGADTDHPLALPPRGVCHAYAPLARIALDAQGAFTVTDDLRHVIKRPVGPPP